MVLRPIFYALGLLLIALAGAMLIPAALNAAHFGYDWQSFILSACITGFLGIMLMLSSHYTERLQLGIREAFLMTTLSWLTVCTFAALPFLLSGLLPAWTDAMFESVSAMTTTGASVIAKLDRASPGILLWRSILQWLGGIGIVVMAMTVLPILKIGGMQLYRTESSDRSEKILPRASQIATSILAIQAVLTCLAAMALLIAGLSPLDALCHAMAAIATGGFSTHDASIAYYGSAAVEWVLMIVMVIGACPILIFIKAWQGQWLIFTKDRQVRLLVAVIAVMITVLTLWRTLHDQNALIENVRAVSFFVISSITSSGFVSSTLGVEGALPAVLALIMMSLGGCAGSTAGGIKILRVHVLLAMVKAQVAQLRRPHGVFIPYYDGRPVDESIAFSVMIFVVLYGVSILVVAACLAGAELPFATCLSASASAVANAGVFTGGMATDALTLQGFPHSAKWALMLGMLLGRLEMLTIYVLLIPSFWRR